MNCRFSDPVARQSALPWERLFAEVVGGCPHVSPRVRSYGTFSLYTLCARVTYILPIYTEIGSCDLELIIKIFAYFERYRPLRSCIIRS